MEISRCGGTTSISSMMARTAGRREGRPVSRTRSDAQVVDHLAHIAQNLLEHLAADSIDFAAGGRQDKVRKPPFRRADRRRRAPSI